MWSGAWNKLSSRKKSPAQLISSWFQSPLGAICDECFFALPCVKICQIIWQKCLSWKTQLIKLCGRIFWKCVKPNPVYVWILCTCECLVDRHTYSKMIILGVVTVTLIHHQTRISPFHVWGTKRDLSSLIHRIMKESIKFQELQTNTTWFLNKS